MKTTIKILAVLVAIVGFSAASYAQSATASVTIITPITMTKSTDMSFGNVAVSASQGGTVVLAPAGTRTRTDGVSFSTANPGTVTAATFTLAGAANYGYSVTLPGDSDVTVVNGANSMTVTSFTSSATGGTGTLDGSGAGSLSVGATLNVSAGQATGTYTSTNFTVTVAYN